MSHQFYRLALLLALAGLSACQPRVAPSGGPAAGLPRGQVTLVEVGASWDAPSRAGQAVTEAWAREFSAQGLKVEGWVLTDGATTADWPAVSYPRTVVTTQQLARLVRVRALPTRLLVDRQGVIRQTYPGVVLPEQARADIATLLKEP